MKLTEGLFCYPWEDPYENNCNSYLIQGDRTILIDPGHSQFTVRLFKEMRADGFLQDQVDLILTTHCHPDHMEGLEAFLDTRAKRRNAICGGTEKSSLNSWEGPFPVAFFRSSCRLISFLSS